MLVDATESRCKLPDRALQNVNIRPRKIAKQKRRSETGGEGVGLGEEQSKGPEGSISWHPVLATCFTHGGCNFAKAIAYVSDIGAHKVGGGICMHDLTGDPLNFGFLTVARRSNMNRRKKAMPIGSKSGP